MKSYKGKIYFWDVVVCVVLILAGAWVALWLLGKGAALYAQMPYNDPNDPILYLVQVDEKNERRRALNVSQAYASGGLSGVWQGQSYKLASEPVIEGVAYQLQQGQGVRKFHPALDMRHYLFNQESLL